MHESVNPVYTIILMCKSVLMKSIILTVTYTVNTKLHSLSTVLL